VRQCVVSLAIGLVSTFHTARTQFYMNATANAEYSVCYVQAMSELFRILILCYIVGLIAVYFSKSRKKA
jgi:hypothetical protein